MLLESSKGHPAPGTRFKVGVHRCRGLTIPAMKISSDDQKAISLILIYTALLFFLIGMAARFKMDFHYRAEISTAGLSTAAVFAALGVIVFLFSWRKKQE